jgi:heptosyltransferase-3
VVAAVPGRLGADSATEDRPLQKNMKRILVIRGGGIGDFILTLPALKALRDANPQAHIEILGYKHIAALAENRFYAQAVRSIEYGPLSSFFAKNAVLLPDLANYFASFDLIISYLYDPDRIFENNLRRCGTEEILPGPARIGNHVHAARQLARPLEQLGVAMPGLSARIYPTIEDRDAARDFLRNCTAPGRTGIVALHPGSGSEKKNWPLGNWIELGNYLLGHKDFAGSLVIVSGEADDSQIARLESVWNNSHVRFAKNMALPELAAVLEQTIFIGHDSGISHLAAAAGAKCILLFGPTDPNVWAPKNDNVRVIRGADGKIENIEPTIVEEAVAAMVRRGRRARRMHESKV